MIVVAHLLESQRLSLAAGSAAGGSQRLSLAAGSAAGGSQPAPIPADPLKYEMTDHCN